MLSNLKKKILDNKHDDLLRTIQTNAIIVMSICVLTFFVIRKLFPSFLWINASIFFIALVVVFGIGCLWFLKQFLPYRDAALKQFYKENPDLKPKNSESEE